MTTSSPAWNALERVHLHCNSIFNAAVVDSKNRSTMHWLAFHRVPALLALGVLALPSEKLHFADVRARPNHGCSGRSGLGANPLPGAAHSFASNRPAVAPDRVGGMRPASRACSNRCWAKFLRPRFWQPGFWADFASAAAARRLA